jgi:hypothetical protein
MLQGQQHFNISSFNYTNSSSSLKIAYDLITLGCESVPTDWQL